MPERVERKTLSLRRIVNVAEQAAGGAAAGNLAPARASAIPLKRLTAGRKELSILHDGSTYLLRVTKSNKLILTKA